MAKNVLIIGANRGIGLALANEFRDQGWVVHGSIRPQTRGDPSAEELGCVATKVLEIDYLDEKTIEQAANQYGNEPLHCLVNCAGVSGGPLQWQSNDGEIFTRYFQTMVVGPVLATKHFERNLLLGENSKIVNISSICGSISENDAGGKIAYKVAKAGLNQATRTIAMDFKKRGAFITTMSIDPGVVATRLNGWKSKVDVKDSVRGIYSVMDSTEFQDTGLFWSWNGLRIPY
ncbi:short chain dehydrogenase [Lentithecium fluviatile CBS 122367]|uniref:Short chain dehydrogenase n=1 Tax=Lentithecium fluviatile CBS 122367 TaxID=1168545 RepID=A0A6G1J5W0_9PLEO|nr:short chain dehydrogenase [Lentithecium fluviatile CBS 122367]